MQYREGGRPRRVRVGRSTSEVKVEARQVPDVVETMMWILGLPSTTGWCRYEGK